MPYMRAKMIVVSVLRTTGGVETIEMMAVPKATSYAADGLDEDNTYAKYSPQGKLSLTVANPALQGKINPGEKFYLDFNRAEA